MTTALITGASSGLGEEFAYQLAREKYGLALVARRKDRLESVATKALKLGASNVSVFTADLAAPGAVVKLLAELRSRGLEVGYLVNNAGVGTRGRFADLPLEKELDEISLNLTALVSLTRLCLPAMLARKSGTIINVASTAAFQPVPWMATYGGTKAFVLSWSEAIAHELRGTGVTVTALCPGPTRTGFQAASNVAENQLPSFAWMDSATVVAQALAAAKRGKAVQINGVLNFLAAQTTRIAPRALVTLVSGAIFRVRGD